MAFADPGDHSSFDLGTAAPAGLFAMTESGLRCEWVIVHQLAMCFGFDCMGRAFGPCVVVWEGQVQPLIGHSPDVVPQPRLDYVCPACWQTADDFVLPQVAVEDIAKPPSQAVMAV